MTRHDPEQPTCNVDLDAVGHEQCGRLAIAKQTVGAGDLDVWTCEDHITLIDPDYIEDVEV